MNKFTTTYNQIKQIKPLGIRGIARNLALDGLFLKTKAFSGNNLFSKHRIQFLYIHHVFQDELYGLEKLLNILSKQHTFISYSEAVERILNNNIDKAYIVISSDDGFKNNLDAAKIFDKYNIKACFFINPDTIGLTDYNKVKEFCFNRLNFPPTEFMTWRDVELLLKNGHEIGSHTMGHINVSTINIKEFEDNLCESYDIIKKRCGKLSHFAYPYGRLEQFSEEAFNLVFNLGFESCASAIRGCHIPYPNIKKDSLLIRRDHIICDWNINHILYFILNNSKKASFNTSLNPYQ